MSLRYSVPATLGLVSAFLLVASAFWVVPAYFESRTYNRLTGAETSTLNALWVELRVQDAPRETP